MRESVCECGFYDLFSLNLLSFPVAENCQSVWDARFFPGFSLMMTTMMVCFFLPFSRRIYRLFFYCIIFEGNFSICLSCSDMWVFLFPSVLHKIPYKFDMIFIFSSSIRFLPWLELSWKSITPGRNVPSLREQKLQLLLTTFYWFRWWCWRWLVGWLHSGR